MHILVIGLNYKTAPVEVREQFAFNEKELDRAIAALRATNSIQECVIVGTCNRTEIYAVVDQLHTGRHYTKMFFAQWFGMERECFDDYLYVKEDDHAVQHLFQVICGLDSMVLGETQILGQMRTAFIQSQGLKATGTIFNTLFKQAIVLAKRAHSETEIGKNAVSISYAAIELGKKMFTSFSGKTAVILGAGQMGELTGKHLLSNGIDRVFIVNRSLDRAHVLAEKLGGIAYPLENLPLALMEADVVISSTGADNYVVTKSIVQKIMDERQQRTLFLIDIAVPRDIEPTIKDLEHVYLYDIDDLEGMIAANMDERIREAQKIEGMIIEELASFKAWLQTLGVVPVITALREKALQIQAEAVRKMENKLPELTEKELRIIRKYTKTIINQLLHDPLIRMKEMAAEQKEEEGLDLFIKIFALEEFMIEQLQERKNRNVISICQEQSTLQKMC